ncbi:putative transposable element [Trichonephila clavipes]|nr:putative transposable element [Trichonephila clavipes]
MEDTSLRIASFSSDRLDGPDRYTRDLKYPHNQKSSGVKSGSRGGHGYLQLLLTILSSPNVCIRNALTGFVEWAQNEIAVVPDFHKRILFSDEAHFWLNGYVNKQNCRIWSEANPQVYVETPLHPEKLFGALDGLELWFQQDGATCHTARATIDLLKDTFGDRLISRFEPVNWPPRSCDLTPLDYFVWGYVKSLVYADKPQTLDHLEDHIHRVIADIRPQMLEKVIENWTSRLDYIRASRGSHMPEFIFKM